MQDGAGRPWTSLGQAPALQMVWRRLPAFRSDMERRSSVVSLIVVLPVRAERMNLRIASVGSGVRVVPGMKFSEDITHARQSSFAEISDQKPGRPPFGAFLRTDDFVKYPLVHSHRLLWRDLP